MCKPGDTVEVLVMVPAALAHEGHDTWKVKPIDRCIAPIVKALIGAGIYTTGSCCGHGKSAAGSILLADGRELSVIAGNDAFYDSGAEEPSNE